MPKIDFNQVLVTRRGEPLLVKDEDNGKTEVMRLGALSVRALDTAVIKGERPGDTRRRWKLAGKIEDAKEAVDLDTEQVKILEQCLHTVFPAPKILGPALEALLGED